MCRGLPRGRVRELRGVSCWILERGGGQPFWRRDAVRSVRRGLPLGQKRQLQSQPVRRLRAPRQRSGPRRLHIIARERVFVRADVRLGVHEKRRHVLLHGHSHVGDVRHASRAGPCDASALPANAESFAPDNGGDCTATLASGSSCSPQCTIGFYPVAATCVANAGTLTRRRRVHQCTIVVRRVGASTNGANEGTCSSALASGSTCAPACLNGYSVNGTTTCAAGTLTSVATCDPDPCNFVAPNNAADAGSCTATLLSGDTCSPTCASGYTRSGVTSCLAGTLTSATCDPDPCDASALPADAESLGDCTATLASGSSCEPTCDLGYVASVATCFAGNLTAAACDREASCDASALPRRRCGPRRL